MKNHTTKQTCSKTTTTKSVGKMSDNFINFRKFILWSLFALVMIVSIKSDDNNIHLNDSNFVCETGDDEKISENKILVPVVKRVPEIRVIRIAYPVPIRIPVYIPIDEKHTQRAYYEGKQPYNDVQENGNFPKKKQKH